MAFAEAYSAVRGQTTNWNPIFSSSLFVSRGVTPPSSMLATRGGGSSRAIVPSSSALEGASTNSASAPASLYRRQRWIASSNPFTCRSEEHTSELQSQSNLVCRLLLEKKKIIHTSQNFIYQTSVFQYPATRTQQPNKNHHQRCLTDSFFHHDPPSHSRTDRHQSGYATL